MSDEPVPEVYDRISTINLTNNLKVDLNFEDKHEDEGKWSESPPATIQPGTSGRWVLKDKAGFFGSKGWVRYGFKHDQLPDNAVTFTFGCPNVDDNYFQWDTANGDYKFLYVSSVSGFTKNGNLNATVSFAYTTVSYNPSISALTLVGFAAPIRNTRNSVIGPPVQTLWTPSTANSTRDDAFPGVAGSYACVAVPFNNLDNSLLVDIPHSDSAQANKLPIRADGWLHGTKIFESDVTRFGTPKCRVRLCRSAAVDNGRVFALVGDVNWRVTLTPSGQTQEVAASTRLEIYGISQDTTKALCWKINPVPVTFLRLLLTGINTDLGSWATTRFLRNFGFKYGTNGVPCQYARTGTGIDFKLTKWMEDAQKESKDKLVICYDQAAVVQISLAFLFGDMRWTWLYISPCGFVKTSYLVGVGDCNNPFCDSTFQTKDGRTVWYTRTPTTSTNDQRRSAFGNHACVGSPAGSSVETRVYDANAGPHVGNQDLNTYLDSLVDSETTNYEGTEAYPSGVGKANPNTAVGKYNGIASLDSPTWSTVKMGDFPPGDRADITEALERAKIADAPPAMYSNANVQALGDVLSAVLPGRSAASRGVYVGPRGTQLEWSLDAAGGERPLRIKLVVLLTHEEAVLELGNELAAYQVDLDHRFGPVAPGLVTAQLALESRQPGEDLLWVQGNLLVSVTALGAATAVATGDDDIRRVARAIDGHFSPHYVGESDWEVLSGPKIGGFPSRVKAGARVTLPLPSEAGTHADVAVKEGHILSEGRDAAKHGWSFVAVSAGREEVTVCMSHPRTMAVVMDTVTITVEE